MDASIPNVSSNGDPEKADDPRLPETPSLTSVNGKHGQTRAVTGFRWFMICVGIFSANMLYGLDTTIAADIQAPVAEAFDNYTQLGWLGIGFTLGATAFILPLGKAYAIFDTKWLFISCLTMFAAGSALCGGAPDMNSIIVGRVWAGAGGAGMYLGNLNLITMMTTAHEQPFYIGLVGLVYGGGCILGPIVGGSFVDSAATWRWAFYINLVIFAAMAPIYLFLLPSLPRQHGMTFTQKLKNLDWLGIILSIGMYVSFVLTFTFAGALWAWNDARIIALFVVFGIILISFCITQYFSFLTTKEARLFPGEFLRSRSLVLLYILMSCGGAALFVAIYYIPLYFQFVHGDTGTQAAVRLLPFVCFYVAVIVLCGYLMGKTGYYMLWYLVSGIFITIGGALMYIVRADTPAATIYGFSILLAIGMTTTQAAYAIGPILVKPDRVVECIQFLNISQVQSQLLGLTIASQVFQSLTLRGLGDVFQGSGYTKEDIQTAIGGVRSKVLSNATPEVRAAAIDVIVRNIGNIYVLAIAAGVLYIVCSCFLKRDRWPQPH
ncbi:hypothetical protein GX51_06629 [Blastomyces parvus]|uniref:Major facilitator superfamily (MFS) profile domain-containing protein n=1 Tax=Blastomyces parvus TaxID=2060905 RepID=A0A2B7WQJ7_9EURO|nr:hypothetical protein GX51_06629 [Blastomyces parvus]